MLASLSLRNMKRQLSEYKIYWLSLIGVVALMYAFNSLIVSPTRPERRYADQNTECHD